MRLAYILSTFPCRSEVFAAREMAALGRQGFTVVVFAAAREDVPRGPEGPARIIYRPRLFSGATLLGWLHVLTRHPVGLLRLLWLILILLRECPGDARTVAANLPAIGAFARCFDREGLCHIHAYFLSWPACIGLALAAVNGASLSMAAHARDVFVESGALRRKVARARFVVLCTQQALRSLQGRLPVRGQEKLRLCHHGIELPTPPPPTLTARAAQRDNAYTLACVGRLVPKKGHLDLVQAFVRVAARWPGCRLILVGSGPEQERIRQFVQQAGLAERVEWRGWQSPEVCRQTIAAADLLVVPSVVGPDGDRDGIPNVILEAFVARTPVVATRLEGIAEAVTDHYNGVLVRPGDVAGMAQAIEEVLGDTRLQRVLSGAAYRTAAERFDLGKNTQQLARWFEGLCATT